MITITIYTDEENHDRFQVHHIEDGAEPVDVTDQYMIAAAKTEDGKPAFVVRKK